MHQTLTMMKRLIPILAILSLFASSCSKSPEKKAEALIKDAVAKNLVLPDTYQPVETTLDSAFTPYHDPKAVSAFLDLFQTEQKREVVEEQMKRAKSQMALWNGPYMTSYGREQYQQAKDEYESYQQTYEILSNNYEQILVGIGDLFNKEPEFIGYRAHHRFRANNNEGATMLSGYYFLLDKDLTKVVAQWDEDDINIYNEILQQAQAASEMQQQ